jgi:hypothetical protein
MHADGYTRFEALSDGFNPRDRLHGPCPAQIRRHQPLARLSDRRAAIGKIEHLNAVEKEARGSPPDRCAEHRKAYAVPVFDDLKRWLALQLSTISGKSPLASAIRNALSQTDRLRPYLDQGILSWRWNG